MRVRLDLVVRRADFFRETGLLERAVVLFLLVVLRFLDDVVRFLAVVRRFLLAATRFLALAGLLDALRDFLLGFEEARRDVERTEPFLFLRDAAAFNCSPCMDCGPDSRAGRPGASRVRFSIQGILAEGVTGIQAFLITRSRIVDRLSKSS